MDGESYAFGSFQLVPERRLLLENGKARNLGSRALDILTSLVESAGEAVSNARIMARAWPATTVDEGSLRVHISALRKVLGDGQAGSRFIANIPGRGYVFVAPVARGPRSSSATAPDPAPTRSLPPPLAGIIGRADTIAALTGQLARRRFVTIVGAGGIGKTTVAVAAADAAAGSYPDGVWFIPLASLTGSDLVASAVGAALGVAATGPDPLPGLAAWLRDKQALIVLDNCEHVVDAAAHVAETIVQAVPHVTILATSREPLRARGESLYRLASLETPTIRHGITADEALTHTAVALFNERARACDGAFVLTDANASQVCEICRRLDGLPLALELAASQMEAFGVQGLSRGLSDRFALLSRGRRTAVRRQQTLRATMDWSYDLLPDTERIALRRLAVFRGDFTMEAASAIMSDKHLSGAAVMEAVANLATKSLIATDISGEVTHLRLLETTRAYALGRLEESADADATKRRHAAYYLELFAPAETEVDSRAQPEWIEVYGRPIDNLRSALDWAFSPDGDAQLGVALTAAALPLWIRLSLLSECRERVERALANLDEGAETAADLRMRLSAGLGWALMYGVGRAREASAAWTATLELAEGLDNVRYRRHALWGLCIDQFNSGNVRTALDFARRFAGLVEHSTNPIEVMMGDRILATSLHYLGDQTSARHHIDRALLHEAVARQPHTVSAGFDLLVSTHYFQARILWLQGYADQALRVVANNIEEGRALDQALSFCSVLGQGACPIAFLAGDLDAAERYGAMLIDHTERHPVRLWNIWARCFIALVTARRGDVSGGLRALREGLEQAGEAKYLPRFLLLQGEQAQYLQMAGEAGQAIGNLDQMLTRCEARDEGWYVPELLRIKGEVLLAGDGATTDVEALFLRSLEEARRQGALSWELRAATSLARLWLERGHRPDAKGLLGPVYARFTEGFATADLQAAGSLLEALR